ncbi:MAG TPA: 16S rRNA (cytidine(1402)-2'-O)-methyltransferase [Rhodocyclaceae bacterium]|nr:16S rRNA (cytidine(1402)-2'-O)-methyltransferase [Rhodocyclaceae bacterium]
MVATPIGNLGDITQRARELLGDADVIACEDTRHSAVLLRHIGARAKLLALHEHNEARACERVLEHLEAGRRVALISDAGTPGISDPGARTVARVREAGFAVVPIPGPNAAIAALSAAGMREPHFLFFGFLPSKPAARRKEIAGLRPLPHALVFYEAPHRIVETVDDLASGLEPARELVIARELTKTFETVERMPLAQAPAWLAADANRQRGEFVLIVSGAPPPDGPGAEAERILRLLLAELPLRQAVGLAAQISGAPRNALYRRALELGAEE